MRTARASYFGASTEFFFGGDGFEEPGWLSSGDTSTSFVEKRVGDEFAGQQEEHQHNEVGPGADGDRFADGSDDTLAVSTALSEIRLDLGATVEQLEWTVNAYNLSFAVLLITTAALGDRFGRRRLYAVGLGLFAAASAAGALAPDVGSLIAARAVQGVGAALIMPLGLALLSAAFPAREARCGDRHLERDHRTGRRQRPADGKRRCGGSGLAVDLLDQCADRAGLHPTRADQDERELRARHRP